MAKAPPPLRIPQKVRRRAQGLSLREGEVKRAPVVYDERDQTKWGWMVQHREHFDCAETVDIGAFTYINARYGVYIEDDVEIGSHCSIYSHSTIDHKQGRVRILQGAKIGAHSIIMPGVTVGRWALVAACSFVNKDVREGEWVAGVPAKHMQRKEATTQDIFDYIDRRRFSHHDLA